MRVTDLEEFAVVHLIKPYAPLCPELLVPTLTLDETYQLLMDMRGTKVERMIMNRLHRMGIEFAYWICHPLVDLVEWRLREIADEEEGA